MFNLFTMVKSGASLAEIRSAMNLLKLVVVDLNEPMGGYSIEKVFSDIEEFIKKDTDVDLDESYFLTTKKDLDAYFAMQISKLEDDLLRIRAKRREMVDGAYSEIRNRG